MNSFLLERIVGAVLMTALSLTVSPHYCFSKVKRQTDLTQRQAAKRFLKEKITKRPSKSKKERGLWFTVMPLHEASLSVLPTQFVVNLKYSSDMEALIEELKSLGDSEELNVRNQCRAENGPGGIPDLQADERASPRTDPANIDTCGSARTFLDEVRASASLDPTTKLKNCIAQSRPDFLKMMGILSCMAPSTKFQPQNMLATLMKISGEPPQTVDPNPIEHVADWSVTQGISVNDRGEVGSAGSFSVNGFGGRGSITAGGSGNFTFTGGPMFGETYSFTTPANGQSQSSQPMANTVTGRAPELTNADIAEVASQNPPPQNPPPKKEREEEEEDTDPPSDKTTTTPIDPASGGSQIPEECQREMMEQAKERGEDIDYNGDPGRTDPEDPNQTGERPMVVTCIEESVHSFKQDDCELDQRTFRDPDQPSLCDDRNSQGEQVDRAVWDRNYGRIDPDDTTGTNNGNTPPIQSDEPDCEMNPTDPRCINPE
ncbi:MAG: hypothetical protein HYT77_02330 [Deltaproteobacteria bacterium]|nr:hypothetical protein [Deltaproteobacteria bacterium]